MNTRTIEYPGVLLKAFSNCLSGSIFVFAIMTLFTGCSSNGPVVQKADDKSLQTVWPAPPEQARIRYVGSLKKEEDVTGESSTSLTDRLLGKKNSSENLLTKPYGVHSNSAGKVYVTDTAAQGLVVFDLLNKNVSYMGVSGPGTLKKALGVTTDLQGYVYVSDSVDKRIVVFDLDGNFIDAYGGREVLESPAGLVFNEVTQLLYVVDVKKHQVIAFNTKGEVEFTIGHRGNEPGLFNYPTNISINNEGNLLFVADSLNFRIQVFNADGTFVRTFGQNGDGPGSFSRLKGLGVDTEGHIYAVDAAFNNFQILDQTGQLLLAVGRASLDADGFYLPAGAHVDRNNRIYIADQYNQRIQMFQYLSASESL